MGGAYATLSLLFINAAFADISQDRLANYKNNGLISQDFIFQTSSNIVTFDAEKYCWIEKDTSAKVSDPALLEKYQSLLSLNKSDWDNMDWSCIDSWDWADGYQPDALFRIEFLADILKGNISPTDIGMTYDEVKELNFKIFKDYGTPLTIAYPFHFTGTEDFSGLSISMDMTNCTGIKGEQILAAAYIYRSWPKTDFSGLDFSGVSLEQADLRNCTGITAAQLLQATYAYGIECTPDQFNTWKQELALMESHKGLDFFVYYNKNDSTYERIDTL